MHEKRSMRFAIQVAACDLCYKAIDPSSDCWRKGRSSGSLTHPLCLAAFFLIDDSPSRLDYEIVDEVNERADELNEMLCENPAHRVEG